MHDFIRRGRRGVSTPARRRCADDAAPVRRQPADLATPFRRGQRGGVAPAAVLARRRADLFAYRAALFAFALLLMSAVQAAGTPTRIFAFGAKPLASLDVKRNGTLLGKAFSTKFGSVVWSADVVAGTRFDMLSGTIATPVETPTPPSAELDQNYPNPFNPSTRIPFSLAQAGHVLLRVFDVKGAHVATVHDGILNQGRHTLEWTGRNDDGQPVASGMYLYTLTTNDQTLSRKMVVLK